MHDDELLQKSAGYEAALMHDPSSFVQGVVSFCKAAEEQASAGDVYETGRHRGFLARVLPWVLALGGGYLAMKAGSGWGRYANATNNPNGPVKGPIMKMLELSLPKGNNVLWPGQKAFDDVLDLRRAQDNMAWDRQFGNSVSNGTAASLTMRGGV